MVISEESKRFSQCVDFLKKNGLVKNKTQLAENLGVAPSSISMMTIGYRAPSLTVIERFCRCFPMIDFRWLKFGEGEMLRADKTDGLLKKIQELTDKIDALERENEALRRAKKLNEM